jgi:hypothetical protein
MNEDVYQLKWLIVVPGSRIKSMAMVKKNDILKIESYDIFGMKNTYVLRLREALMLNYSHSRNPRCAPARTHGQIQAPREPPN